MIYVKIQSGYVEKEDMASEQSNLRQAQKLLSLIAMKPAEVFDCFLKALNVTEQGHVSTKLTEKSTNGKKKLNIRSLKVTVL